MTCYFVLQLSTYGCITINYLLTYLQLARLAAYTSDITSDDSSIKLLCINWINLLLVCMVRRQTPSVKLSMYVCIP